MGELTVTVETLGVIGGGVLLAFALFKKYYSSITSFFSPTPSTSKVEENGKYVLKYIYDMKIKQLEAVQEDCKKDRKLLNEAIGVMRTAGELIHQTIESHETSLRDGKKRFDRMEEKCDQRARDIETRLNECANKLSNIEGKLS